MHLTHPLVGRLPFLRALEPAAPERGALVVKIAGKRGQIKMASESSIRRLAFIRYLLRLGIEQSYAPEPLCAAAVLSFHDSVELLLQLASEELDAGSPHPNFMDYFAQLDDALAPRSLDQKELMRRLNKSRVALKHHGTMPSRLDIEAFRSGVQAFFESTVPLVFRIDLASVSLAHLVENEATRSALLAADGHIAEERFEDASASLAVALAHELSAHGIPSWARHRMSSSLGAEDMRRLGRVLEPMQNAIDELAQEVTLLRNGIDARRLAVFRKLTPVAHLAMSGRVQLTRLASTPPITANSVRFCYDFVIDTALALQQLQTALDSALPVRGN